MYIHITYCHGPSITQNYLPREIVMMTTIERFSDHDLKGLLENFI